MRLSIRLSDDPETRRTMRALGTAGSPRHTLGMERVLVNTVEEIGEEFVAAARREIREEDAYDTGHAYRNIREEAMTASRAVVWAPSYMIELSSGRAGDGRTPQPRELMGWLQRKGTKRQRRPDSPRKIEDLLTRGDFTALRTFAEHIAARIQRRGLYPRIIFQAARDKIAFHKIPQRAFARALRQHFWR